MITVIDEYSIFAQTFQLKITSSNEKQFEMNSRNQRRRTLKNKVTLKIKCQKKTTNRYRRQHLGDSFFCRLRFSLAKYRKHRIESILNGQMEFGSFRFRSTLWNSTLFADKSRQVSHQE